MKKAFLLSVVVMALAGSVWFNAGASGNVSINADVYSRFFTDARAGEHVPAQLYTTNGSLQELLCTGTGNPGYVSCQFPDEYAGQQIPVQLTKNGIMYVFVVDVPVK